VNRPEGSGGGGSWQVMPFPRNIYNTDFVFVGNPFLKPEYSTQYDINFSSPIPMGFGFINLYYHDIKNKIEWYSNSEYPQATVLTFENAKQGSSTGIEFFMMIMGQTLGGGYSKDKINDDSGDPELNEDAESYSIFNKIKLPAKYIKLFDFEFGLYWMKIKVPTGSMFGDNGTTWANIGISKKFLNDRLTASFTIDNLFDSGGFQMLRTQDIEFLNLPEGSGYTSGTKTTDVFSGRGGRNIKLTFKYQFGKKYDAKNRAGGHSHGGGEMDKTALAMAVIKSRRFISDFIQRHDILVPLMAADGWDQSTGELSIDADIYDTGSATWVGAVRPPQPVQPSGQAAHKVFDALLSITEDKKSGFVSLSIAHYSPMVAQQWVTWLVEDINNTLRAQDVAEAENSIAYLKTQVDATSLTELDSRFFEMIQSQTETIMLAKVREEYAFKTVDPAVIPEQKDNPKRALICLLGTLLGGMLSVLWVLIRHYALNRDRTR
jgi:hypothetical protein